LENGADNEESRLCKGRWEFECKRERLGIQKSQLIDEQKCE